MTAASAADRRITRATAEALGNQAGRRSQVESLQEELRLLQAQNARLLRELEAAKEEIARLNQEGDINALRAHRAAQPDIAPGVAQTQWGAVPYTLYDGRRCITQKQAAAILKKPQYTVSRWCTGGKLAMVTVPDHIHPFPMIDLDLLHIPEKKKRAKKQQ